MSSNHTPIDISNMPDLVRLVEEMKHAKEPRILKKGSAPVAMLIPGHVTSLLLRFRLRDDRTLLVAPSFLFQ